MNRKKCLKCGYWNKWDALYCGLCYEPFTKRPPAEKPVPAQTAPRSPGKRLLLRFVSAGGVLAVAAVISLRIMSPAPGNGEKAGGAPALTGRFAAKTAVADRLLADYTRAKEELLAAIAGADPAPDAFGIAGEYTVKLFSIEAEYAAGIEALGLPGPENTDEEPDAAYLDWLRAHGEKESSGMEEFSRRYRELAQRAGAGG